MRNAPRYVGTENGIEILPSAPTGSTPEYSATGFTGCTRPASSAPPPPSSSSPYSPPPQLIIQLGRARRPAGGTSSIAISPAGARFQPTLSSHVSGSATVLISGGGTPMRHELSFQPSNHH